MLKFVQYKVDMNKKEMEEVKQSGMFLRREKEYAAQPHYKGLNLFPDVFKDSGFVINEDVLYNISPC